MTPETANIFASTMPMSIRMSQIANTGILRMALPENRQRVMSLVPTVKLIVDGDNRTARIETDDYTATIPVSVLWDELTRLARDFSKGDVNKAVQSRYEAATKDYTELLADRLAKTLLGEYKDGEMNLNSQFGEDEIIIGAPAVSCRPASLYVSGGILYVVGEDMDGNEYPQAVKALSPADIEKLIKIYERPLDEDE